MTQETAFSLVDVETAASLAGVDAENRRVLLSILQEALRLRYSPGNASKNENRYHDMAQGLRALYGELGTWDAVGAVLGKSRAYAWRVAHGDLTPNLEAVTRYQDYVETQGSSNE